MRFHLLEVLVIVDILPLLRVLQSVTLQGWRGEGEEKGREGRRGGRAKRRGEEMRREG